MGDIRHLTIVSTDPNRPSRNTTTMHQISADASLQIKARCGVTGAMDICVIGPTENFCVNMCWKIHLSGKLTPQDIGRERDD